MERFESSLHAFRRVFANRRIRKLQIAAVGSTLGMWAYAVALPVYAYDAGGAGAVGLIYFTRFVAGALATPWFGVAADRWSRRRLMLGADVIRAGIFAVMTLVAVEGGSAYIVYVLAVASAVVGCAYQPAQGALLPLLVDTPDELTAANVVSDSISSISMFAGPALAGVLLALSGPAAVFAFNGALLLWSALFVIQLPRDKPPVRTERPRFLPDLAAGFATVLRQPAIRVVVGLTGAQTVVAGAVEVLIVVVALQLLHAGNAGVGWINSALGIGCLAGAAGVAVVSARRRLAGGFALGILVTAIPVALVAAFSTLPPALVLFALFGAGTVLVEVSGMTLLQRSAENEVLGRVFGVLGTLVYAALAVGSLLAPALVSWIGARGALIAIGAFLPILLVPLWPSVQRIDAEARIAEEPLELLRRIAIFSQLPEPVLERLAAGATAVSTARDQVVVERGEVGNHFYVIALGRVAVELDDGSSRELGPGDFFGEIALLRDVPRTATVRALDPLRLYAVQREEFLAAVTGHGPSLTAAESVVTSRLPVGAMG